MDSARPRLRIGRRFCGPPGAANGGFASGSLAALLGSTVDVEVSLRRSVPLERPLGVHHDGDALLLEDDGWLLAWLPGRDGRKLTAGSALLGSDGEVLAAARALWITFARTAGGSR